MEQGIHGVLERARRIGGPYEAAATVIGGLIEEASTAGLELDLLTYISVGSPPTSLNGLRLFDMCTCPPLPAPPRRWGG
ncbi:hypothetical protein [Thermogymnomonas acidicola]|uniref:hypothetical protein n=1 Tax=Thermogymnomonas acidicola TaxID=399579 RepID=UPI001396A40A|nr:hypothetical protein [Thermogymnomonas acidicola]